jgi:hypothetical protein
MFCGVRKDVLGDFFVVLRGWVYELRGNIWILLNIISNCLKLKIIENNKK